MSTAPENKLAPNRLGYIYRRAAHAFALELAAEHTNGEAAELEVLADQAMLALAGDDNSSRLTFAREVVAHLRHRALWLRNSRRRRF